jgi:hypothetical protein
MYVQSVGGWKKLANELKCNLEGEIQFVGEWKSTNKRKMFYGWI